MMRNSQRGINHCDRRSPPHGQSVRRELDPSLPPGTCLNNNPDIQLSTMAHSGNGEQ